MSKARRVSSLASSHSSLQKGFGFGLEPKGVELLKARLRAVANLAAAASRLRESGSKPLRFFLTRDLYFAQSALARQGWAGAGLDVAPAAATTILISAQLVGS